MAIIRAASFASLPEFTKNTFALSKQYVEYISNQRLLAIGYEPEFDIKTNPLPWMNSYLVSDNVQVAPQEAEISSYLVGQVDSSVNSSDFAGFEL